MRQCLQFSLQTTVLYCTESRTVLPAHKKAIRCCTQIMNNSPDQAVCLLLTSRCSTLASSERMDLIASCIPGGEHRNQAISFALDEKWPLVA